MPKFQDHVPTIQVLLLVNEIYEFLGFHDDIEISLSLHLLTDTLQFEILFEEIGYCTPDSSSNAQIRLSAMLRKLLTALVFQYRSFLHNYQILWLIIIQTIYHVYNSSNVS